jgi:hypothetical protein
VICIQCMKDVNRDEYHISYITLGKKEPCYVMCDQCVLHPVENDLSLKSIH